MNMRAIVSIVLIMLFLLIFTFIFKTDGSKTLKGVMILVTFLVLPLFIITYLNVFTEFWSFVSALIIVGIIGVLSIVIMVKLDYVELKWD